MLTKGLATKLCHIRFWKVFTIIQLAPISHKSIPTLYKLGCVVAIFLTLFGQLNFSLFPKLLISYSSALIVNPASIKWDNSPSDTYVSTRRLIHLDTLLSTNTCINRPVRFVEFVQDKRFHNPRCIRRLTCSFKSSDRFKLITFPPLHTTPCQGFPQPDCNLPPVWQQIFNGWLGIFVH